RPRFPGQGGGDRRKGNAGVLREAPQEIVMARPVPSRVDDAPPPSRQVVDHGEPYLTHRGADLLSREGKQQSFRDGEAARLAFRLCGCIESFADSADHRSTPILGVLSASISKDIPAGERKGNYEVAPFSSDCCLCSRDPAPKNPHHSVAPVRCGCL